MTRGGIVDPSDASFVRAWTLIGCTPAGSMTPNRDQRLAELPVQTIDMAQQPFLQIAQNQADAAKIPVNAQVLDVVEQAAMLLTVADAARDLVLLHQSLLAGEVKR